jgi:sodium/pantothenate symporter
LDIYTVTIAISIIIYIAIGNYAGRGIKRLDDYYVAGRRAPTLIIVGTLVASLMSTTMFLGEAGFAYNGQAGPYVIFPQVTAVGYVIGAILFGRYLRRSRATTVAEFFGKRFASPRVQAVAGFTIVFALGGYLLAVTQGAAILLSQLTELGYVQAVVIAWLSYTAFTMYSGSRGVILTDTLMFLLFTFASIAAIVFLLVYFGGWPTMIEDLVAIEEKPELMSWHGVVGPGTIWPTPMDYLIWTMVIDISWLIVVAVSPWQASRHLMAKNEHVVVRAACIACVAVALMQAFVYGMGGAINLAKADIVPYESATIWASLNLLPAFLGALMLAGFMAAALSSASTFLSLVGFSASNDIGVYKEQDETKKLRFSRLMMFAIGTITLIAALVFPPDIFWLTTFLANDVHRNGFCIIVGPGRHHEYLEQTHHRIRRVLGHAFRPGIQCRSEILPVYRHDLPPVLSQPGIARCCRESCRDNCRIEIHEPERGRSCLSEQVARNTARRKKLPI